MGSTYLDLGSGPGFPDDVSMSRWASPGLLCVLLATLAALQGNAAGVATKRADVSVFDTPVKTDPHTYSADMMALNASDNSVHGRAAKLWASFLPSCPIIWHVHIPKTGGMSVKAALERLTDQYVDLGLHHYVYHGLGHRWGEGEGKDLLQRARQTGKHVVVSAETGITDLVTQGYPWFEHTCFLSVVREPHEWVLSADNHMRVRSNYTEGIAGTWGYFDLPNVQRFMVGHHTEKRGVATCITTIAHAGSFLAPLTRNTSIPHINSIPHPVRRTAELEEVVRRKYGFDVELWEIVEREQFVCW